MRRDYATLADDTKVNFPRDLVRPPPGYVKEVDWRTFMKNQTTRLPLITAMVMAATKLNSPSSNAVASEQQGMGEGTSETAQNDIWLLR